jgi:hypothetical protein
LSYYLLPSYLFLFPDFVFVDFLTALTTVYFAVASQKGAPAKESIRRMQGDIGEENET